MTDIETIIQAAGLHNSLFKVVHSFTKDFHSNIAIPDIEIMLKQNVANDLAEYTLEKKPDSFLIEAKEEPGINTIGIELVILTKEELKRLINVCINL